LALPALLTAFRKRHHADTSYIRTAGVFPSRQALIDYEEALGLEAHIDEALSGQTQVVASPPATSDKSAQGKGKGNAAEKGPLSSISPRVESARVVRKIWTEVNDRWKTLVNVTDVQERSPGLERFDCGAPVLLCSWSIITLLI
jgi:fanconi-associated nuclease 1